MEQQSSHYCPAYSFSSCQSHMSSLFKSTQERLREHQLFISRSAREIDRLRISLEAQERGIVNQVRQAGARGELGVARILARQLVITRRHVHKFYRMGCELASLALRVQGLRSTEAMAQAMEGVTEMMGALNSQFGLQEINETLLTFEQKAAGLDLRQRAMDAAMEATMGEAGDTAAVDAEIANVLSELHVPIDGNYVVPTRSEDAARFEEDLVQRMQELFSGKK